MGFNQTIRSTVLSAAITAKTNASCPTVWRTGLLGTPNSQQDSQTAPGTFVNYFVSLAVTPVESFRNQINGVLGGFGRRHRFILSVHLFTRNANGDAECADGADWFVSQLSEKVLPAVIGAAPRQVVLLVSETSGFTPVERDGGVWFAVAVHTEGYYDEL